MRVMPGSLRGQEGGGTGTTAAAGKVPCPPTVPGPGQGRAAKFSSLSAGGTDLETSVTKVVDGSSDPNEIPGGRRQVSAPASEKLENTDTGKSKLPTATAKSTTKAKDGNLSSNTSANYKARLCLMWQQWGPGTCKYGSRCSFAHGEHELRSPHLRRGGNAPGDSTSTAVPPGLGQGQDLPQQEGMPQDKDEDGVDGSVDSSDAGPSTSAGIPKRRKTRLCTQFMQTGACEYGEACKFAHGEHEFQKINKQAKGLSGDGAKGGAGGNSKKFKTRLCLKFQQFGQCSYGNSCSFAHGIEELAWKDPWARTAMMHMSDDPTRSHAFMPHAGMAPGQDLQMPPAMMMFQGSQVAGGPMDRGHHGPNADRQGWPMMSMPFNASPQSGMMPVQGNVMGVSSLGGHGFYNSMSAGFMPGQQSMSFVDMQPPSPHAGYFEMQQQLLWMQQNQQNLQQLLQVQQELHKLRLEQQNNFKLKPEQPGVHDSAGLEMPQKEISPPMLAPSVPGPDNPQESEGPARTPSE